MLINLAFRNLIRQIRNSLTIILSVASGDAALILFDAFNVGLIDVSRDWNVHTRYGNGQIYTKGYLDEVFEKPWTRWIDNQDEIEKVLKRDKRVQGVYPRLRFHSLVMKGDNSIGAMGEGIVAEKEENFFYYDDTIVKGKNVSSDPNGVLLGFGLARSLNAKVGDTITLLTNTIYGYINGLDLKVTGIFKTHIVEIDDRYFQLHLSNAQKLMDTNKIEYISLGLNNWLDWDSVKKEVEGSFANLEAFSMDDLNVYFVNMIKWLKSQYDIIRGIILLIMIAGIFNTVSCTVLSRLMEIGTLKANGESVKNIMILLFWESNLQGILGGLLGISIALILSYVNSKYDLKMPPGPGFTDGAPLILIITIKSVIVSFVLGVLATVIGTVASSYKVTKTPISAALRNQTK